MTWFLSQFHFFHMLMWACAGRSANMGECSLNAFGVKDDCMTMVMPVSKGNNLGLYDDAIHMYANPYDPVTLRHEVLYTIAVLNHFIFFPTFLAFKN